VAKEWRRVWGRGKTLAPTVDAGPFGSPADGALEGAEAHMAADEAGAGVHRQAWGGEDPLPGPFPSGVGVLAGQGIGQVDGAVALGQVLLVQAPDLLKMFLEGFDQRLGQDGNVVLLAFAVADGDSAVSQVQVLDAQAEAFHQAQTTAVKELGDEEVSAGEVGGEGLDLLAGEDGGRAFRFLSAEGGDGFGDWAAQDFAVEEQDGLEGLIPGGGGDLFVDGQVGEEGLDFGDAHLFGMAFVVEEDVAPDPVDVSFFGAVGVVFAAQRISHAIQQFRRG